MIKRRLILNKKADQILGEQTVFIILNLIYFVALLFFVIRGGSDSSKVEQVYAKEISLAIDKAKPGTNISWDISELYKIAKKNEYSGLVVRIDNNENKVIVNSITGVGYQYYFFSNSNVLWNLDKENERLYLKVV